MTPSISSVKDSKEPDIKTSEPTVVVAAESEPIQDDNLDEAAAYLAEHTEFGPLTPELEKKLVRKIDMWIIPMVSEFTSCPLLIPSSY